MIWPFESFQKPVCGSVTLGVQEPGQYLAGSKHSVSAECLHTEVTESCVHSAILSAASRHRVTLLGYPFSASQDKISYFGNNTYVKVFF